MIPSYAFPLDWTPHYQRVNDFYDFSIEDLLTGIWLAKVGPNRMSSVLHHLEIPHPEDPVVVSRVFDLLNMVQNPFRSSNPLTVRAAEAEGTVPWTCHIPLRGEQWTELGRTLSNLGVKASYVQWVALRAYTRLATNQNTTLQALVSWLHAPEAKGPLLAFEDIGVGLPSTSDVELAFGRRSRATVAAYEPEVTDRTAYVLEGLEGPVREFANELVDESEMVPRFVAEAAARRMVDMADPDILFDLFDRFGVYRGIDPVDLEHLLGLSTEVMSTLTPTTAGFFSVKDALTTQSPVS